MSDDCRNELTETAREAQAARAERDAEIDRLNRAVAEERQHAAELRRTVDELRFKMDILERSYSKQLEDARLRAESAEQKTAEHGVRLAELDGARNDAIELLTEAKAELDRLNKDREQLRRQLASRDGWEVEGAGGEDFDFDEGTINGLLNDDKWIARAESEHQKQIRERASAQVVEDSPTEDMIAPELVLTRKTAD
jgi:DNA repair exonuclease SbcCD ATPase subunit